MVVVVIRYYNGLIRAWEQRERERERDMEGIEQFNIVSSPREHI